MRGMMMAAWAECGGTLFLAVSPGSAVGLPHPLAIQPLIKAEHNGVRCATCLTEQGLGTGQGPACCETRVCQDLEEKW